MKVTVISDTHGQHRQLDLEGGDLLIHAGDISGRGYQKQIKSFLKWFAEQPFTHKVFIGGNHDFFLETHPKEFRNMLTDDYIYLENSSIEIEGIKIWGSPISPFFFNWAFNRHRGKDIKQYWDLIPTDTDILITHGPPMGILDTTSTGLQVGCQDLMDKINEIHPQYHLFGHIHEAYGVTVKEKTTFINASVLNLRYEMVNAPVLFDI